MKNFTQLLEGRELDVQENGLNFISAKDLEKYVEVAGKFLSPEALLIIGYMIEHNSDYVNILGGGDTTKNCLEVFYSKPAPKDAMMKKMYSGLIKLEKENRLLEIPTLQTKEQFEAIINQTEAPDSIILDLKTEKGRNAIVHKYENLVNKIVNQWIGKSNLDRNQLKSAALEGLVNAMNSYGKKNQYKDVDDEKKVKSYTFGQYAAYAIRFAILSDIKNVSHNVRIPVSAQNRERKEKGANTKSNTLSGDQKISDEENAKSLFDFVGGTDTSERNMDYNDLNNLWADVFKVLEQEFDKKVIEAWYSWHGLNGRKKQKNKEIADRLGCNPSLVTYYCNIVTNFIKNDKRVMKMMSEIYELMKECLHDIEYDNDVMEDGLRINNATSSTTIYEDD